VSVVLICCCAIRRSGDITDCLQLFRSFGLGGIVLTYILDTMTFRYRCGVGLLLAASESIVSAIVGGISHV